MNDGDDLQDEQGEDEVLDNLLYHPRALDRIPDVRDGLTRVERVILWVLSEAQKERRGRNVSTFMLYGRVVEYVDISQEEFQRVLKRMVGK